MSTNKRAALLAETLRADGYAVTRNYRTGGNCDAVLVQRPNYGERHALITDGDAREPWTMLTWGDEYADADESRTVVIAVYENADDDVPAERTMTDPTVADVKRALCEMFGAGK